MSSPYSHKSPTTTASSLNSGGSDQTTPSTTFVQANPSNFRSIVQKLTGASPDPSTPKLPITVPSRLLAGKPTAGEMGPRKPPFKLQERRQNYGKKLEIKLNFNNSNNSQKSSQDFIGTYSSSQRMMVSPVSPLDMLLARVSSPKTPISPVEEEEERAIADKGFYLHPSPLSTPRGSEPELLPLFPTHSPRQLTHESSSSHNSFKHLIVSSLLRFKI